MARARQRAIKDRTCCEALRFLTWHDMALLIVYLMCQTCYTMSHALLAPNIPAIAQELHKKPEDLNNIVTYAFLVGTLTALVVGPAQDYLNARVQLRRRSIEEVGLIISMLLLGLASCLVPVCLSSKKFELFCLVFCGISSVAMSVVNLTSTTLALQVGVAAEMRRAAIHGNDGTPTARITNHHDGLPGGCLCFVHIGVGAGVTFAPLLCNLAGTLGLGRVHAWTVFAPIPLLLSALIVLLPAPADMHSLSGRHIQPMIDEGDRFLVLRRPSRSWSVLLLLFAMGAGGFTDGPLLALSQWLVTVGTGLGMNVQDASSLASLVGGAMTLGRVAASLAGVRMSPALVLTFSLFLSSVGIVGLAVLGDRIVEAGRPAALTWAFVPMFGFGAAPGFPWALALHGCFVPMSNSNNGVFLAGAAVGMIVCINVSGKILSNFGETWFIRGVAGFLGIGVMSTLLLYLCGRHIQRMSRI